MSEYKITGTDQHDNPVEETISVSEEMEQDMKDLARLIQLGVGHDVPQNTDMQALARSILRLRKERTNK